MHKYQYQQKAIPLIIRESNGIYQTNPEALQLFASIKGPVSIISVAGAYRTGKSFLLNTMLLNCKHGFAVGPTINPKTKGIWIWGKPLTCKTNKNELVNVIVMDSEGLGSTQQDANHDLKLFSIALMLSSTFLYNSLGTIDQNAIDNLALVLRLCEHLKNQQNYQDSMPQFFWILRDFSLMLVNKQNKQITADEYLQSSLHQQQGDSQMRNKVRQSIKAAFKIRHCKTFFRPLTDEKSLQNLSDKKLEQLRPEFIQQVLDFRKCLFENVKIKQIRGKQIKGQMLCDLINSYVQVINSFTDSGFPILENGWKNLCKIQCQKIIDEIEKKISQQFKQITYNKKQLPKCNKQLLQLRSHFLQKYELYYKKSLKDIDQQYKNQSLVRVKQLVNLYTKKLEVEVKKHNAKEIEAYIQKELDQFQKSIKSLQTKSIPELLIEFQNFNVQFKKNCPYKDEIEIGSEFIFKKLCDNIVIAVKNFENKRNQEVKNAQDKYLKTQQQHSNRDDKTKNEKSQLLMKIAVLQTKLQESQNMLENSNKQMKDYYSENSDPNSLNLTQYKEKLQLSEKENFKLKKKNLELQQQLSQIQSKKIQIVSKLEKQNILQGNKINNLDAELKSYKEKYSDLIQKTQKQQHTYAIQLEELQRLKNQQKQQDARELQKLKIQLENRLQEIENLIVELETTKQKLKAAQLSVIQKNLLIQKLNADKAKRQQNQIYEHEEDEISSLQNIKNNYQEKIKEIEQQKKKNTAQLLNKIKSVEHQQNLLNQKIYFMQNQLDEKTQKCIKLTNQNNYYLAIFESKETELQELHQELQQAQKSHFSNNTQLIQKLQNMTKIIHEKESEMNGYQFKLQQSQQNLAKMHQQNQQLKRSNQQRQELFNQQTAAMQREMNELLEKLKYIESQCEEKVQKILQDTRYQKQSIKQSSQLSLLSLKNMYEMERQNCQKKLLQDRKKYEEREQQITIELENSFKEMKRQLLQEIENLKKQNQQQTQKNEQIITDLQVKIAEIEELRENERKSHEQKYKSLEQKYVSIQEQIQHIEKLSQQQTIQSIKKTQTLNIEILKKDKLISQLNSQKENLESHIARKQQQNVNIKQSLNVEIELLLTKMEEQQSKYKCLNEQYLQLKTTSDRDIALAKQSNQFLNMKIQELQKERNSNLARDSQRVDKHKQQELKDLLEKYKNQIVSLQNKLQSNRKALKQQQVSSKKDQIYHQKLVCELKQKLALSQSRERELEQKVISKSDQFKREIESLRTKYQTEKNSLQFQIENLKNQLNDSESKKNESSWKVERDIALLNQKIRILESQKDQAKKQQSQTQKRLDLALSQLRKLTQKNSEDKEMRRASIDKKYIGQMQLLKDAMSLKNLQQDQTIKRLKQNEKIYKQRNARQAEQLQKCHKYKQQVQKLAEANNQLRNEKQELLIEMRMEILKVGQQWKQKYINIQKKYKQIQSKNASSMFREERAQCLWKMQKDKLEQHIRNLQSSIQLQAKSPTSPKSNLPLTKNLSETNKMHHSQAWK